MAETLKKIFIAYADHHLAYSLKRIGRQARCLGCFDEVILYTPDDLPEYIRHSPLMQQAKGGGYWAWKPAIIHETLQKHDEGDIVVYVDAGCTLNKSTEWDLMFKLMLEYDTVCFHYDAEMPVWEKFGNTSTRIKYWTKQSAIRFLDDYCHDTRWHEALKVMGGILFIKGKDNRFLRQWLDIVMNHPEVISDPTEEELQEQPEGFAFHKHEQSVITALANNDPDTLVLPEISDTNGYHSFVYAERLRASSFKQYLIEKSKHLLRHYLGDDFIDGLKHLTTPQ